MSDSPLVKPVPPVARKVARWLNRNSPISRVVAAGLLGDYNPFHPDSEPHQQARRLWRRPVKKGGVFRSPLRANIVRSHKAAMELLRSPHTSSEPTGEDVITFLKGTIDVSPEVEKLVRSVLIFQDSGDAPGQIHTQTRRRFVSVFSSKAMGQQNFQEMIERRIDGLSQEIQQGEPFDVIELLSRVPQEAIATVCGWASDEESLALFESCSNEITRAFDVLAASATADLEPAVETLRTHVIEKFMQARTALPANVEDDNLIEHYAREFQGVTAGDENYGEVIDEVVAAVVTLMLAAKDTTARLIGSALMNATQQGLLEVLKEIMVSGNEDRIDSAFQEALRTGPSINLTQLALTEPVKIDGKQYKRGDVFLVPFSGPNFDPNEYTDPYEIDYGRFLAPGQTPSLSFSAGVHQCAGVEPATMLWKLTLAYFFKKFPNTQIVSDLDANLRFTIAESKNANGPSILIVSTQGQLLPADMPDHLVNGLEFLSKPLQILEGEPSAEDYELVRAVYEDNHCVRDVVVRTLIDGYLTSGDGRLNDVGIEIFETLEAAPLLVNHRTSLSQAAGVTMALRDLEGRLNETSVVGDEPDMTAAQAIDDAAGALIETPHVLEDMPETQFLRVLAVVEAAFEEGAAGVDAFAGQQIGVPAAARLLVSLAEGANLGQSVAVNDRVNRFALVHSDSETRQIRDAAQSALHVGHERDRFRTEYVKSLPDAELVAFTEATTAILVNIEPGEEVLSDLDLLSITKATQGRSAEARAQIVANIKPLADHLVEPIRRAAAQSIIVLRAQEVAAAIAAQQPPARRLTDFPGSIPQ